MLQCNNIFLNENPTAAQFDLEKIIIQGIFSSTQNFSLRISILQTIVYHEYYLPCSMNCYVIYLVFEAKLELKNDHSFLISFN